MTCAVARRISVSPKRSEAAYIRAAANERNTSGARGSPFCVTLTSQKLKLGRGVVIATRHVRGNSAREEYGMFLGRTCVCNISGRGCNGILGTGAGWCLVAGLPRVIATLVQVGGIDCVGKVAMTRSAQGNAQAVQRTSRLPVDTVYLRT